MRNEPTDSHFEAFRERKQTIADAERVTVAQSTPERECVESACVDDDIERKLTSIISQAHPLVRVGTFVGGAAITFLVTVCACVIAMANALSWPLSDVNLQYAQAVGASWGGVGGLIVGTGASTRLPDLRAATRFIGVGSVVWAGVTSFCFWVFLVGMAAC